MISGNRHPLKYHLDDPEMTRPLNHVLALERSIDSCPELTCFQRKVYRALCHVPSGRVTTYRDLAHAAGSASARAVGSALRKNPLAPEVPCHRVIRADRTPGGYAGAVEGPSLARKLSLLEAEGVVFRNGRLADPERLMTLTETPNPA